MKNPEFKDKFIGFVDVLGFKSMTQAAEDGTGRPLSEVLEIVSELGRDKHKQFFETYGPQVCPHSKYLQKNIDFQLTQVSDCVIVSCEISPAGIINLINHCWSATIRLLTKGVMVRGYITRGNIYHNGSNFLGTGYNHAYQQESGVTAFKREADEKGTPFVEVDTNVCDYVSEETDDCVREMFGRYVKKDREITALFPFQRLSHSFMISGFGPPFDPEKEKQSNDNLRQSLKNMKDRIMQYVDHNNTSAIRKTEHYILALDEQLKVCDETDQMINLLCQPFPSR